MFFNPQKDVILAQIEAAGGIEYYKGQILWVSMARKILIQSEKVTG